MRPAAAILLLLLTAALLPVSASAQLYVVPDSVRSQLDAGKPLAVKGVWRIGGDATVLIKPASEGLAVVSVHNPDLRIKPGTVLGTVNPDDNGTYTCRMFTRVGDDGKLKDRRNFVLTVGDEGSEAAGTMTLEPQSAFRLDFWLLFRRLFTLSLRRNDSRQQLTGVRMYPNPAPSAENPVIL